MNWGGGACLCGSVVKVQGDDIRAVSTHPLGWLGSQRQIITSVYEVMETRTLVPDRCVCQMMQLLWKTVLEFLKKLNVELAYIPESALLSVNAREMKTCVYIKTDIHSSMYS